MKKIIAALFVFSALVIGTSTLPVWAQDKAGQPQKIESSDYSVRGDKVFYKGAELAEATVNEVESPQISYWSMINTLELSTLPSADMGVHFFNKEGQELFFIFLEADDCAECNGQDVAVSADGQRLLLMGGPPMGPEVTYTLYNLADLTVGSDFAAVRGSAVWLDPDRFLFSKMEGYRTNNEDGGILRNCLESSAVLHDAAADKSIVLKQSDATHSYSVGLAEDGKTAMITEESVKNEKDWEDDEKIISSDFKAELPVALGKK